MGRWRGAAGAGGEQDCGGGVEFADTGPGASSCFCGSHFLETPSTCRFSASGHPPLGSFLDAPLNRGDSSSVVPHPCPRFLSYCTVPKCSSREVRPWRHWVERRPHGYAATECLEETEHEAGPKAPRAQVSGDGDRAIDAGRPEPTARGRKHQLALLSKCVPPLPGWAQDPRGGQEREADRSGGHRAPS